ncbi:endonuclease/exonuclease/phosphatase family protein [Aliiroseovarius sp. KMU-50]|uniref:Endonuclease/exonuclease/phosphatase family protein n=1 Tax=Aliiroseovarius salicola TaxID=3009082 RepID=A0ABT4VX05_9RHOB|nr:endonuclease/exonuclease/phosphatase family protein [Aliiroseovarius sp. KMU-50]MDA5092775.1 endonuclease/exonuclease/phosphatase family protein [Aliiroseovarius sp. KMU-50]
MPLSVQAERLRIATFNSDLSRDGPGLLLRDITRGKDKQISAVIEVIAHIRPDVLVLQDIDNDLENRALAALQSALAEAGHPLPHRFATLTNAGMESGLDLDGDGHLGTARDSQGYGSFTGQGGMAVLSRLPLGEVRDFSDILWRSLPGADLPQYSDGSPFPSEEAQAAQRLSSVAHWDVPVMLPDGKTLNLLTWHGSTPAFDGAEDQNGKRGADEARFWLRLLDGDLPYAAPTPPFAVIGQANIDPTDGEGRHDAINELLSDPRLIDPTPTGSEGTDTADWSAIGVGKLRAGYILPWAEAQILDTGVFWPAAGSEMAVTATTASRHHLIWLDLNF